MGRFENVLGANGQFYFNLLASNGQILFQSEGYKNETARNNGISMFLMIVSNESNFERKLSATKKFYFIVKATDGNILGFSRMYESEASRDNGIEAVKNNALDALAAV
ncbi:MAG TPA: YegP family protein [Ferruginibacter sp.]|nr:YegP family protein [Ferruginibacter sp.]HRE63249.1 YegP family protein [Ferruginibacter sp.]